MAEAVRVYLPKQAVHRKKKALPKKSPVRPSRAAQPNRPRQAASRPLSPQLAYQREQAARRKRARLSLLLFRLLAVSILAAAMAFIVLSFIRSTQVSMLQQESRKIRQEISDLEVEKDYVTMELKPYMDDERMEGIARNRLGMDYPTDRQLVTEEELHHPLYGQGENQK